MVKQTAHERLTCNADDPVGGKVFPKPFAIAWKKFSPRFLSMWFEKNFSLAFSRLLRSTNFPFFPVQTFPGKNLSQRLLRAIFYSGKKRCFREKLLPVKKVFREKFTFFPQTAAKNSQLFHREKVGGKVLSLFFPTFFPILPVEPDF